MGADTGGVSTGHLLRDMSSCSPHVRSDEQQLDENELQSVTEGCTDGDWNWMCIAVDESTSAAGEVVGPAPTQLESCDELIHFDHEYCTTASPPGADVAVCSKEVVCEVEVCSEEEQPADLCQPNTEIAALPNICDLDLSVLADPDLWDNLEQIIDVDQLLEPSSATVPAAEIPSPQFTTNQESLKPIKTSSYQSNGWFDINSPLCDTTDIFSVERWSSQSSRSDFETSSSGVGSPFSDELVDSDDYGFHWEESFTELFPALV